jgi:hypothetical protein
MRYLSSLAIVGLSTVLLSSPAIAETKALSKVLKNWSLDAKDTVLVAQRSSEFDDESSDASVQNIPAYPSQVSPDTKTRPDFNNNQDLQLRSPFQRNAANKIRLPIRLNFSKDNFTYSAVISENKGWNIIDMIVTSNDSRIASRFSIKIDELESKLVMLRNERELFHANKIDDSLWLFELTNFNGIKQAWNHQVEEHIAFEGIHPSRTETILSPRNKIIDKFSFLACTNNPGFRAADQISDRSILPILDSLGSMGKTATGITKFASKQDPTLTKKDKSLIGKIIDRVKKNHKSIIDQVKDEALSNRLANSDNLSEKTPIRSRQRDNRESSNDENKIEAQESKDSKTSNDANKIGSRDSQNRSNHKMRKDSIPSSNQQPNNNESQDRSDHKMRKDSIPSSNQRSNNNEVNSKKYQAENNSSLVQDQEKIQGSQEGLFKLSVIGPTTLRKGEKTKIRVDFKDPGCRTRDVRLGVFLEKNNMTIATATPAEVTQLSPAYAQPGDSIDPNGCFGTVHFDIELKNSCENGSVRFETHSPSVYLDHRLQGVSSPITVISGEVPDLTCQISINNR